MFKLANKKSIGVLLRTSILKLSILTGMVISPHLNATTDDKPDAGLLLVKLETFVQEVLRREGHPLRISTQGRFEIKNSAGMYTPFSVNVFTLEYETPLEFRPLNCPTNFRSPRNCRLKVKTLLSCESTNQRCQEEFRKGTATRALGEGLRDQGGNSINFFSTSHSDATLPNTRPEQLTSSPTIVCDQLNDLTRQGSSLVTFRNFYINNQVQNPTTQSAETQAVEIPGVSFQNRNGSLWVNPISEETFLTHFAARGPIGAFAFDFGSVSFSSLLAISFGSGSTLQGVIETGSNQSCSLAIRAPRLFQSDMRLRLTPVRANINFQDWMNPGTVSGRQRVLLAASNNANGFVFRLFDFASLGFSTTTQLDPLVLGLIESNDFFKRINFDELKKYPHVLLALSTGNLRVSTIDRNRPQGGQTQMDEITLRGSGENSEYQFSAVIENVSISGQVGRFKND